VTGPTGATGPQGPQGPQGFQGFQGATGTFDETTICSVLETNASIDCLMDVSITGPTGGDYLCYDPDSGMWINSFLEMNVCVFIDAYASLSQSISSTPGTPTTVLFDTIRSSDGALLTLSSGEVTVSAANTYEINYRVSTDNGNTVRAVCRTFLELDTGSGFTEFPVLAHIHIIVLVQMVKIQLLLVSS
jgi:hypothetical protein